MTEKSADGVTGFLLYSPFDQRLFFRVYHGPKQYTDYKIAADDIEVTLVDPHLSLYEDGSDNNKLDYSSAVLGKETNNGQSDSSLNHSPS
jgi:hypothetical protein